MVAKSDDHVVLQLRLHVGMEDFYWNPTLAFLLEKVDGEQREKLEFQANIAMITSEVNQIAKRDASSTGNHYSSKLCNIILLFCTCLVASGYLQSRGIAVASMKPVATGCCDGIIHWKPNNNFNEKIFLVNPSGVQVMESGLLHVSIMLRHRNCRSDIAFKVYHGIFEIARVYDDACGWFSNGISKTYVHTIPVEANDTLSVKYVGGGKLFMDDSFMDVLLLPPNTH
ncbi:hypothetical protein PHMEG_0008516 [Phytophthora megakarya]|uniref:Uncharacterized protein n=1 Tax=Phytophthora megakarya TaxID=4795 RepID=A0A225WJV1_9STRA|nr:hypothetical protein PHMEG_0008516 [Phytophthora megakarya]